MRTVSTFTTASPSISPSAIVQKSPWHSPAPYLFAGVASMLVLITFALVILACSYWRRSGYPRENGDAESGAGEKSAGNVFKASPVFEEKIVVIMAGDLNPTFLATPISSRGNSFGAGDKIDKKFEKESGEFDDVKSKDEVIAMEVVMDQAHEESQIGH